MRRVLLLAFASYAFAFVGAAPDENGAIASVQRLFDAMAKHNANDARALFTPGAALTAVRANGAVSNSKSEEFVAHVGAAKQAWLERMWNPQGADARGPGCRLGGVRFSSEPKIQPLWNRLSDAGEHLGRVEDLWDRVHDGDVGMHLQSTRTAEVSVDFY